jgi:hypothetical protein
VFPLGLGAVAKERVRTQKGVCAVGKGQAAIHAGFTQRLPGQHGGDHIRPFSAIRRGKVQTQQAEIAHLAEGFKIERFFQVVFLNAGNDLFFGEPDHLFFEHELFSGKRKIHLLFSLPHPAGGFPAAAGPRQN